MFFLEGEGKIKNLKLRIVKEEEDKSFIKREISYTHGSSQTRKVYQFQVIRLKLVRSGFKESYHRVMVRSISGFCR